MQTAESVIKSMVHLAMHGSTAEWKSQYLNRLYLDEIGKRQTGYPLFDYEYAEREVLYKYVNKRVLQNAPIDYLEFGVYGGESFRSWLKLNDQAESRFWGFDSFQGLPEDWTENNPKGAFDRQGRVPQVDDARADFVIGWFQDSLPGFLETFSPRNRLVMHMDADLFTSTLYVLMNMDRFIRPGTVVLFDEFKGTVRFEEFEALHHYACCCRRQWRVLAARRDHVKLAIEITE
ncbi:MAG: TylF/MycF/NovP-related O-methyltransferase [Desulfovibrionaceae bacterium]